MPKQMQSSRGPEIGDVFLKVLSFNKRERWPQWQITRLVTNADGTAHAIMLSLTDRITTRRIALAALSRTAQWRVAADAKSGS